MFQTIGEKVSVLGIYAHQTFTPKKVKWGERVLAVDHITLISEIRDGNVKKRLYSFQCNRDLYRLLFNRETEEWILEEIWIE